MIILSFKFKHCHTSPLCFIIANTSIVYLFVVIQHNHSNDSEYYFNLFKMHFPQNDVIQCINVLTLDECCYAEENSNEVYVDSRYQAITTHSPDIYDD